MLAKYAPEYPCLTGGIVNAGKLQAQAFRGFTLHIVLETLPNQPRGYNAADVPVLGDKRGPTCLHLPIPPWSQANPVRHQPDFVDGVNTPDRQGHQSRRPAPGYAGTAGRVRGPQVPPRTRARLAADDVPDLGVLLVGPMARGAEVTLR